MDSSTHATFVAKNGQIVPLRSVHVEGDYVGLLSIMTITQVYQNPIDQALEVTYTFPLAHDATLLDVTIQIRGKTFKSAVFPKYDGRHEYNEAIKKGDTAIIIEQASEFYALKLGNLPGGEEVTITYRYGQFVMPHDGRVRVAIPTTIAPQYGDPQDSGIAPNQAPVTSLNVSYPFSAVLRFHGIDLSRINVVSHIGQITMQGNDCHVAINGATMDRDVVVLIGNYDRSLLSLYTPHEGQHWYANYVHLPLQQNQSIEPMHIKLLVDCSGSMGGGSIRQAQQAVMRLLGLLRDGDSIAVTRFGSDVVDVTPGLMRVGPVIRAQMNNWVKTIDADLGGTEIGGALEHVLKMPTNKQDCVIILLTDGDAYGIQQVATYARQHAHRIFPLVIGYAPNDGELKQLADITSGFLETVTPQESIEDAIERTINKIRFTSSSATNLTFGDAVVAWKSGKNVRYVGEQGLVWAVTDRHIQPVWHHDDTQTALSLITVDESVRPDIVRMMAAQHLNDLNGTYQMEWAMKHHLMCNETVYVAVAAHEADAKVRDEQIRITIAQEMAHDSHYLMQEVMASPNTMRFYSSIPTPSASLSASRTMSRKSVARSIINRVQAMFSPSDVDESHARGSAPSTNARYSYEDELTFGSPDVFASMAPPEDETTHKHEAPSLATHAPALTQLLAKHRNNVTKLTLASLVQVGLSQDQIDACAQITGYSEQLIVEAIVVLIVGESSARKLKIAVDNIPVALLGGLRIVLATN